jgi:hypothetical protein
MKRIIYTAAGTDPQLIKHCPEHEKRRNFHIGLLVLLVSCLSFISVSFATHKIIDFKIFNSIFDSYLNAFVSIAIGTFWFLIVFNLYRACLTISGIGDGTSKITKNEVVNAIPQLLLATILSCCLAVPLNILLLDQEIDKGATISDIDRLIEREEMAIQSHHQEIIDSYMDGEFKKTFSRPEQKLLAELKAFQTDVIIKKSTNFIGILEKVFSQFPFLTILIFIVSFHLYIVPIFLRMLWVKGVYEYLVELQNRLALEKHGIYENYYKVVFQGEHLSDKFLIPERIIKSRKLIIE